VEGSFAGIACMTILGIRGVAQEGLDSVEYATLQRILI
jgi:hypothetical protein